jgi:hypothetical protein
VNETTHHSARKGEEEDKDARGGGAVGGLFLVFCKMTANLNFVFLVDKYSVTQGVLGKKIERMYCSRGTSIELRRIDAK